MGTISVLRKLRRALSKPDWVRVVAELTFTRLRAAPQAVRRLRRRLGLHRLPDTPWLESDTLDAYLDRSAFSVATEQFVRDFARDGYALVDLGEQARALCDAAVAETDGYFVDGVTRIQDAWYKSPAVRALAAWPEIARLLHAAYGRRSFPFQTLNFKRGSQQALHADAIHFHSLPERFMCGVWIALEDVKPGAGPLIYRPGSHKLPLFTMRDAGVNVARPTGDDYAMYWAPKFGAREEIASLPEARALIPKGGAFFWRPISRMAGRRSRTPDPPAGRWWCITISRTASISHR